MRGRLTTGLTDLAAAMAGPGPVRVDDSLARWAVGADLDVAASAARRRPILDEAPRRACHGQDRREHLSLLRRR